MRRIGSVGIAQSWRLPDVISVGAFRLTLVVAAVGTTLCLSAPPTEAANLPDGRAFELVSPADTGGNPAYQTTGGVTAILSDDDVIFGGGALSDGPSQSGSNPDYLAQRSASGWTSASVLPAQIGEDEGWNLVDATSSLSGAVFAVADSADFVSPAPSQQVPVRYVYRAADGTFTTIATIPVGAQQSSPPAVLAYGGMSADGQTVVFSSPLTPSGDAPANGLQSVYAWTPQGGAQPLGRAVGDPLASCDVAVAGADSYESVNGVSADGSTVFLQSAGGAGCPVKPQVFVSVNGHSQEISVSTDGTAPPSSAAAESSFQGATPDGQTAYFTTTTPLTADAGSSSEMQLYRWTAPSGGTPAQVTCVSCAIPNSQGVDGVQVSANGTYVYFQDIESNSTGNVEELLVDHDGGVESIASDSDGFDVGTAGGPQISADGHVIVFTPQSEVDGAGGPLYRAVVSGASVTTPQCITCALPGSLGLALMGVGGDGLGASISYRGASTVAGGGDDALSADGSTVVFTTTNALGAADPGQAYQVDEWTASGGDQFIADGYDNGATGDAAITPDGQDIFLYSNDQLTPEATQMGVPALYDARVGGGFAAPPASPSCAGDACQGPSPGTSPPQIGSSGACCGNVSGSARSSSVSLVRPSAADLRQALRDGRLSVRLTERGTGRLIVSLFQRRGRRLVRLDYSERRLTARSGGRARTITLVVHLSRAVLRDLRQQRRVVVILAATFTGAPPTRIDLNVTQSTRGVTPRGGR